MLIISFSIAQNTIQTILNNLNYRFENLALYSTKLKACGDLEISHYFRTYSLLY